MTYKQNNTSPQYLHFKHFSHFSHLSHLSGDSPHALQATGAPDVNAIIAAAYDARLSSNAACLSVLVLCDAAKIAGIAKVCAGDSQIGVADVLIFIVFDFAKAEAVLESVDEATYIFESRPGFTANALDAGLMLSELISAARRQGLGTVLVDSFRFDRNGIAELLGLPPMTVPMAACGIGHFPTENAQKPRLPITAFRHDEYWRGAPDPDDIAAYNRALSAYWG